MSLSEKELYNTMERIKARIPTMSDNEVDLCFLILNLYSDKYAQENKLKEYDELFAEMAPLLNEEIQHRIGKTSGTV